MLSRKEMIKNMGQLEKEIALLDGAYLVCKNRGVYVTSLGNVYTANKVKIEPKISNIGYFYIDGNYFNVKPEAMPYVIDSTGARVPGEYIQNMVVFSMGDINEKPFTYDLPIDHINMNHADNRPENLELVPTLVNLYRAMVATDFSEKFVKLYTEEFQRILNSVGDDPEARKIMTLTLKNYISMAKRDLDNCIKPKDKKED